MFVPYLKIKKDVFPELIKRMEMLDGQKVSIGVFSEEQHYSGFTYKNLFSYLQRGDSSRNMPPRWVLPQALHWYPVNKSSLKKDLKDYFRHLGKEKRMKDAEKVMENLGIHYRAKAHFIMGKETFLAENRPSTKEYKQSLKNRGYNVNPNAPLVQFGDLKSKISYSLNGGKPIEIGGG